MIGEGFLPLPLLSSPHLQTILSLWVKQARILEPTSRHIIALPDGDQLVLHDNTPRRWRPGQPVAVVLHGLTGSHKSGGIVLQAQRLLQRGLRTFRLDFRGAGAGFRLARGSYHAGCSDDARAALKFVEQFCPGSPILLTGTSLGGNVALKVAGELPEHPIANLKRVAVLNPPIDLAACTQLIALKKNRLYEWHFVDILVRAAIRRARQFGDPPPRFPKKLSLRQFDELHTAPRNGFADADDYYTKSSAAPLVPKIPIPVLILTARDDPFVAVAPIEKLDRNGHVHLAITDRGGHTGFLGRDGQGGIGWAETRMAEWLVGGL